MRKIAVAVALAGVLTVIGTVGGTVSALADDTVEVRGFRHNETTRVERLMEEGLTFEEAKNERLEENVERVEQAVEEGTITDEEGNKIRTEMEKNLAECTTPGENRGAHEGYRLNKGSEGNGKGQGTGRRAGMGLRDGQCVNN